MPTTVKQTDWRGWKITDEQARQITNGDINARNAFYFDNLDRLRAMAYNYAKRNPRCADLAEDMIQGLYIDLAHFKQENGRAVIDGKTLSLFVYSSFRFAPHGGLLYCSENNPKLLSGGGLNVYTVEPLSLDKPFGRCNNAARHQDDDNARTLGETVPAPDMFDGLELGDLTDELKTAVADLLTPRENEYFGYFIEGYGNAEISRRMGYRTEANNGDRVRQKLRNNAPVVLSRLCALGVNVDGYKDKTPYNPKTERNYKLSPEQRARAAESMRRQRAAKKAAFFESALSKTDSPAPCLSF